MSAPADKPDAATPHDVASASSAAASPSAVTAAVNPAPAAAAAAAAAEANAATTNAGDAAKADEEEEEDEDDDPNAPPPNPLSDSDSEDEDGDGASGSGGGGTDVRLGFLEEAEHPSLLLRTHFPCKAGGRPAWLNPRVLPSAKELQCVHCSNPLVFLLQLYAPLRTTYGQSANTFHRTLFLFCCLEKSCENKQRSVVCLRSQLPLDNPFYPSEPLPRPEPLELDDDAPFPVLRDPTEEGVHLCAVCGNPAPSSCAKCHQRRYCSRLHQLWDWKQGGHKGRCATLAAAGAEASAASAAADSQSAEALPSLLFPQKEIVIEPEYPSDDDEDDEELSANTRAARAKETPAERKTRKEAAIAAAKKKSKAALTPTEARLLAAYEKAQAEEKANGDGDKEDDEDEEDVASTAANWASPKLKDPLFLRFKARIADAPEQVLRYDRAAGEDARGYQPLWVSTYFQPASPPMPELPRRDNTRDPNSKPTGPPVVLPRPVAPSAAANDAAVPPCARCGSARRFEFQLLPQLLYYLGDNAAAALDFATVAVYTCSNSCGDGVKEGYFEEFAWVQAHAQ
jgi:pre-rRNA-processing protein TSR4